MLMDMFSRDKSMDRPTGAVTARAWRFPSARKDPKLINTHSCCRTQSTAVILPLSGQSCEKVRPAPGVGSMLLRYRSVASFGIFSIHPPEGELRRRLLRLSLLPEVSCSTSDSVVAQLVFIWRSCGCLCGGRHSQYSCIRYLCCKCPR